MDHYLTPKEFRSLRLAITAAASGFLNRNTMPWRKEELRIILAKLLLLHHKIPQKLRSMWFRPIFSVLERRLQGDSDNLIITLKNTDPDLYFNYLRMSSNIFQELLEIIDPRLDKQVCIREPISACTRLQICLRYLASGDSMRSIGYAFRVAPSTISNIVEETCKVIWEELHKIVMPIPTTDTWKEIANDFNTKWNFPNCCGAVDGRHMVIEAPPHSGSVFFSHKKTHSFVLTGLSDAYSRFIFVDVGAEGRRSDGGICDDCALKQRIENNTLNFPEPQLVGNRFLPFVWVGDEAYTLTKYMMTPYPRSGHLDLKKKVFNYRQSRARRIIECAFGILVARWRIFRKPMASYVDKSIQMVLAAVCLHNFIINHEIQLGTLQYRKYNQSDKSVVSYNFTRTAAKRSKRKEQRQIKQYREEFAAYFMNEGAVLFQWEKALNNDF